MHINFITILERLSLYLERRIFDNIYNLASHISYYNAISDGWSDVLNLLHIHGISMLTRI